MIVFNFIFIVFVLSLKCIIVSALPINFDVRNEWSNCISPVVDSRACGALSWPLSVAQTIGDRLCIATNSSVSERLSPEPLICAKSTDVCFGELNSELQRNCLQHECCRNITSDPAQDWKQVEDAGGLPSLSCQPFHVSESACVTNCTSHCPVLAPFVKNSFVNGTNNITMLKYNIFNNGPVSSVIKVTPLLLRFQRSFGVLNEKSSPADPSYGSIGVRIAGFGVFSVTGADIPYWLVLTSFAPDDEILIEMGVDAYGIESNAMYAEINAEHYKCNAGSSFNIHTMKCEACAPGTFSPQAGLVGCTPCEAGTYSNGTGAHGCDLCSQCKNNGTIEFGSLIVDETCTQETSNSTLCLCPPFSAQPLRVERDTVARVCQNPNILAYTSPSLSTSFFVHGAPILLLVLSLAPIIACILLRPNVGHATKTWLVEKVNLLSISENDSKNSYSSMTHTAASITLILSQFLFAIYFVYFVFLANSNITKQLEIFNSCVVKTSDSFSSPYRLRATFYGWPANDPQCVSESFNFTLTSSNNDHLNLKTTMVSNDTSEHCSVFVFVDEIVDLDYVIDSTSTRGNPFRSQLVVVELRTFKHKPSDHKSVFSDHGLCDLTSTSILLQQDPPCDTTVGQSLSRFAITPPLFDDASYGGSDAQLEVVSTVDAVQRCAHETATLFNPLSFIRETCRFCPSSMRKFEIGALKWSESRDAASFRLRLKVNASATYTFTKVKPAYSPGDVAFNVFLVILSLISYAQLLVGLMECGVRNLPASIIRCLCPTVNKEKDLDDRHALISADFGIANDSED